jgi:prepilin-type N-terminal cleavage/methylation domain-containing protein/prepilin-type processing-associated H-X9-DG protein
MKTYRRAFTLVETVVVTAILGVIMALAIPGLQAAREAARRVECKSHLKQLGIALHNYHELHNSLPLQAIGGSITEIPTGVFIKASSSPAGSAASALDQSPPDRFAWSVALLPLLDQKALYEGLDPGQRTLRQDANDNRTMFYLQHSLSVFTCPSDPGSVLNSDREFPKLHPNRPTLLARSNYPGSGGNVENTGVIVDNAVVRFRDVTDGLSTTFLVGERASTNGRRAALWGGTSQEAEAVKQPAVRGLTAFRMNDGASGTEVDRPDVAFSSLHSKGANFLLGDGSVRFISDTIDWSPVGVATLGIYNRLGDRADGLVIGE